MKRNIQRQDARAAPPEWTERRMRAGQRGCAPGGTGPKRAEGRRAPEMRRQKPERASGTGRCERTGGGEAKPKVSGCKDERRQAEL